MKHGFGLTPQCSFFFIVIPSLRIGLLSFVVLFIRAVFRKRGGIPQTQQVIVFYVNFDDWRLATMAFVALSLYGYVTVRVTLWRKKFRQATNKHDNDYHDKATDR